MSSPRTARAWRRPPPRRSRGGRRTSCLGSTRGAHGRTRTPSEDQRASAIRSAPARAVRLPPPSPASWCLRCFWGAGKGRRHPPSTPPALAGNGGRREGGSSSGALAASRAGPLRRRCSNAWRHSHLPSVCKLPSPPLPLPVFGCRGADYSKSCSGGSPRELGRNWESRHSEEGLKTDRMGRTGKGEWGEFR